ncbi:2Fe-2S iron-sulfur cluster binding domain-containing protein [Candidatus Cyanaurora vandensis]|uniref:2Fe-2S iron-sulfur cluster-binding protein n=1 Tax=Candidatus Cyanaurora vandensis TaxID=2714958 RepID=UPI0025805961|nr:2Fe-2S iron-sulfur cluster binding domain-containing protein [Candidatus Cyanaurora vandensis]
MAIHQFNIHNPATGDHWTLNVRSDRYLLAQAQAQGVPLPFLCAQGVCTTCAVRVQVGRVHQPEAFGISSELKQQGYALLCVGYARSDLQVELQTEDEVYDQQFGTFPAQARPGLPLDLD